MLSLLVRPDNLRKTFLAVLFVLGQQAMPIDLDFLGWKNDDSVCKGHFEPLKTVNFDQESDAISVKSDEAVYTDGETEFRGHVIFQKKGLFLTCNKAIIKGDPKNPKDSKVFLEGPIIMKQGAYRFQAMSGEVDLNTNTIDLSELIYRVDVPGKPQLYHIWGKAKSLHHHGYTVLKDSTYSTSSPEDPFWLVHAQEVKIDEASMNATIKEGTLSLNDYPVFFFPRLHFSFIQERKSGFLLPDLKRVKHEGWQLTLPYYFNLAPNYDLTMNSIYNQQRKWGVHNAFRFLTPKASGNVSFGGFLEDDEFDQYQQKMKTKYQADASKSKDLTDLLDASLHRKFFRSSFQQKLGRWKNKTVLNWAEDSVQTRTFDWWNDLNDANYLENSTHFTYNHGPLSADFGVLGYQNHRPVDEDVVKHFYDRLPEINVQYDPELPNQFTLNVPLNVHHFLSQRNSQYPEGWRYHVAPSLGVVYPGTVGYWSLMSRLNLTHYHLKRNNESNITRWVPTVTGEWGTHSYSVHGNHRHHWSPALTWHYAPYVNQKDIPLFDTDSISELSVFKQEEYFFNGRDRISDRNDWVGSLEYESQVPEGKAAVQLASGIRVSSTQVCLLDNCNDLTLDHWLPVGLKGTYQSHDHWHAGLQTLWFPKGFSMSHVMANVSYDISDVNQIGVFAAKHQNQTKNITETQVLTYQDYDVVGLTLNGVYDHLTMKSQWLWGHDKNIHIGADVTFSYQGCGWSTGLNVLQKPLSLEPGWKNHAHPEVRAWFTLAGLGKIGG